MADYDLEPDPEWVYLSTIFDLPKVPVDVATLLRQVVVDLIRDDVITKSAKWQALEVMAANTLELDRSALAIGRRARDMVTECAVDGKPRSLTVEMKDGARVALTVSRP
jgi:hypothetical protein